MMIALERSVMVPVEEGREGGRKGGKEGGRRVSFLNSGFGASVAVLLDDDCFGQVGGGTCGGREGVREGGSYEQSAAFAVGRVRGFEKAIGKEGGREGGDAVVSYLRS